MKRISLIVTLLLTVYTASFAQQKYFVDGFHGGVYGHYPLATYTQFLVDQMNMHPNWYIGLEIEPETWDTVKVKTPEAYLAFQKKLATDQVEYTNPSYGQSYLYCITGESIIRQFTYGIKKIREHFPSVIMKTYSVEEPCFTSCLPTLLPQLGFRYAVLKCPNTCWGGYGAAFGGELINLVGPDGTSIVSVPRYACEDLEKKSVWQTMAWGNNDYYFNACFDYGMKNPVGMTYQDAGWTNGPWIGVNERRLKGTQYTRWTKYIEEQSIGTPIESHRYSIEDVCPGLMWGSQVLSDIAQRCRITEYLIPRAEKMAAMAHMVNGFNHNQKNIDEAWRQLLLSQHHDCWIVPYNRLNKKGTWAENVTLWTTSANELSDEIIKEASLSYIESGKPALKIFNTAGYARKEVVSTSLSDGRFVNVEVEVPAFGYTIIPEDEIVDAKETNTIKINKKECIIENDLYRIALDLKRGGAIKSLKKKDDGFEYVDKRAEYALGEVRGYFDAYHKFMSSVDSPATVYVVEDNELVKTIVIEGEIAGTQFQQGITLIKGDPIIHCDFNINANENVKVGDFTRPEKKAKDDKRTTFYDTRYALSVMLPTAMKSTKLYKNAPFDVCESKLKDTFYNDWDSIKHNIVLEWMDLKSTSDNHSLAVFTDRTTSYSYGEDYPLALTALYAGPGLWGRNYKAEGPVDLIYCLVPHCGTWDEARINQLSTCWHEHLIPTKAYSDKRVSKSLISADGTGFELTSVTTEGDDIFVRLFNASGNADKQQVTVAADVKSAIEVDFLGNEVKGVEMSKNADKTVLSIAMPRFGVHTYKLQIK